MAKLGTQLVLGEIEWISRAAGVANITDDQPGERFGCGLNGFHVEEPFHVIHALPLEPRFLRWPSHFFSFLPQQPLLGQHYQRCWCSLATLCL